MRNLIDMAPCPLGKGHGLMYIALCALSLTRVIRIIFVWNQPNWTTIGQHAGVIELTFAANHIYIGVDARQVARSKGSAPRSVDAEAAS